VARINTFLKAIYAGAAACLAALGTALVQAHTFSAVTDAAWITIASATLLSFGAVYGVTNAGGANGDGGGP
jgi:hypothetical protein